MPAEHAESSFHQLSDIDAESPTLIEGLPGLGLVAAIAVDQITTQLELDHHGTIRCSDLPPIASFKDGRVRDSVRVYAGTDPAIMTLQSDLSIPPTAFDSLTECVLQDLSHEFNRAIFLAGAPAQSEDEIGEVTGVTTTDEFESDMHAAGITIAEGNGIVGGVTGALLDGCYERDIPAALLIVKANPYIPDPSAAQAVIETALEPLVEFDIDTSELRTQADEIKQQMHQIAEQYQQMAEEQSQPQPATPSMYQ